MADHESKVGAGDESTGGLPRNYLRATLLLLIGESAPHGYDLLQQVPHLGLGKVDPGRLYRALRVMERDGLVLSCWEHSTSGPARRTYQLTLEGQDWLHAWAGTLQESRRYLTAYLERYEGICEQMAAEQPDGPAGVSR